MSLVLNVEILGEFKKLTQATTGAQNSLQKLQKGVGSISSKINGTLALIGVGFSMNAVISGIKSSIDAASDLEQQFGALESIFKDIAPEMKTFAKQQETIGLSAADTARAMSLLGSQLKGYGLDTRTAADRTQELTKLGADLAATYGGTTYDAVQSISALFRGEYDPIEKYGVAIKKSDVNARLAAEGLNGLTGEALKQAEAQAALTLLFEKTTDAQGQAAREADTYAAKNAALKAEFTNLKAEMGEKLLPVMIQFMSVIKDNWDSIEQLILKFGDLVVVIAEKIVPAVDLLTGKGGFEGLAAGIGGVSVAMLLANSRLLLFAASNPGMAAAIAGLGLIAAGMVTVYNNTKNATSAIQEFQRIQAIQAATSYVSATPEQISGATYKGILGDNPALKAPGTTGSGIAGQGTKVTTKVPTVNTNSAAGIKKASATTVVVNNNVTVKKATTTAADITKALGSQTSALGTSVLRALGMQ